MSLSLSRKTLDVGRSRASENGANERLQDILVRNGAVSPADMFKAISLQTHESARLTDLLHGLGFVDETTLLEASAQQSALPIIELQMEPASDFLRSLADPFLGLKHRFVLWKTVGDSMVVAVADPEDIPLIRTILKDLAPKFQFVLAHRSAILAHYETHHKTELSLAANTHVPQNLSCRGWAGTGPRVIGAILLTLCLTATVLSPRLVLITMVFWILTALIANGILKCAMMLSRPKTADPPNLGPRRNKLPKVSIMLPLLREEDIVDRLIKRMSALVYPKELLEICLIYEESDTATKTHLAGRNLPYWMRKIEVPKDTLQTKPRAMNYALDFCSGDIIGIYDAEDAPEPDQLHKVMQAFDKADETVACVQCQLDFYNTRTNWISCCFTIEYAVLFRVMLPGLQRWNLPVPLGGTSVFFRRDILENLGRWDAQNVTEDADLGIRLYRAGYRCLWADATTYEEANFRILPWVRQRSRWLKGFLQTWITHMRRPFSLLRQTGLAGFLVFQVQMLGTFTSFAAVPLVLPMWLFTLGFNLPVYDTIPATLFTVLVITFICTEFLLLVLGAIAVKRRGSPNLYLRLPSMLFYWPLGAFAAYKALWELFVHPSYWDKTSHGINDVEYQSEIDRLTAAPVDKENTYWPATEIGRGGK